MGILFLFCPYFFSCNEANNEAAENKLPSADSSVFYPVQQYFYNEIKIVENSPTTITMFTESAGKGDSSIITKEQFAQLAKLFLENNIADQAIKKYYRESVFQDETTGSYT
ncbi:MAG TPA: hypothetical protein PLA68_17795, partial [Panacibacter sp.]|nr:hypothetical protein [Panacibacter sp.]